MQLFSHYRDAIEMRSKSAGIPVPIKVAIECMTLMTLIFCKIGKDCTNKILFDLLLMFLSVFLTIIKRLFCRAASLFVAFARACPLCSEAETETDRLISLILSMRPSALLHTEGFQLACAG